MNLLDQKDRTMMKTNEAVLEPVLPPSVRGNHYIFSHFALRQFAIANPLKFFSLMPTERAASAMAELCSNVNRDCGSRDGEDLDVSQVKWVPVAVNDKACVVTEMPKPMAPSEAWFTAALLLEDLHDDEPFSKDPKVRYLTLDYAPDGAGEHETLLCEWSGELFFEHGPGPAPDLHSFVRFLEGFIDGPGV